MPKLIGAKSRDFDGYSVWTFVDDANVTSQVVQRDFGDYYEVTPLKGLVIDETGLAGAFAKFKDELGSKFEDEFLNLPPAASVNFPKLPGEDPIKRQKVWDNVKEEGLNQLSSLHKQAHDKAMARAKEEARLGIKAIDLGIEPSSSGELNKDNNGEIGTGFSSDEQLMKDNSMVEKATVSSSNELMIMKKENNENDHGLKTCPKMF